MSDLVESVAVSQPVSALPWLSEFQREQNQRWQASEFPKRNTEHWKYTNLRSVEKSGFLEHYSAGTSDDKRNAEIAEKMNVAGLNSYDLVFINGHFEPALSALPTHNSDSFQLGVFSQVGAEQQALIRSKIGRVAIDDKHLFARLNGSRLVDGVFVQAKKDAQVDKIIRIVHVSSGSGKHSSVSPRLVVCAEQHAKVKIVEQFFSDNQREADFVNSVSEFHLSEGAHVEHCRLHMEHETAIHVGGVHAALESNSVFDSFQLAFGSLLKRVDIVASLNGPGAHCELNGIYLPTNKQHVDFHTCIEHTVPHCTSNEVFRGIVSDSARAVFNGRIHIHKDAQKTLAKLSNKNLLTSQKAEVDTKPELEIYADDVQCAHGATVAQLDEAAVHYLMTRGVSRDKARLMLSFGFINTLVDALKIDVLAPYVRAELAALLSSESILSEHLT